MNKTKTFQLRVSRFNLVIKMTLAKLIPPGCPSIFPSAKGFLHYTMWYHNPVLVAAVGNHVHQCSSILVL